MKLRPRIILVLAGLWAGGLQAQPLVFLPGQGASDIVDLYHPRIAVAPDGSFALAFEVLMQVGGTREWQIGVQRFSPAGNPVGAIHFFRGGSCSSLFIWTSDFVEHPAPAYLPNGILLVLMQHTGDFHIGGDAVRSAEARLGALDPDGQVLDLNPGSGSCEEQELIFVGGGRQDRPRMALTPSGELLMITLDGFFNDSDLRNVAIRILDGEGNELVEQVVPHDDELSQQAFHMRPDIATSGSLILSTWQECPLIDNQGNADECDIGAQFASITGAGLQALGGNVAVSTGDPAGTLSIWPSAAMNADGSSVVVWIDSRTGVQGDIFGQRFDADGRPVGSNFQVSAGQGVIYDRPEVALLDDGRFMVTWTDSAAVGFRARGRHFGAEGSPLGAPFLLQEEASETGLPDLTSNGSSYYYTWVGTYDGTPALFVNNVSEVVASEPEPAARPATFESYPNPFSAATTIQYTLPEAGHVRLVVYDLLGREVARLVDAPQGRGEHRLALGGDGLPPGPYLVRLQQGLHQQSRLLIRVD